MPKESVYTHNYWFLNTAASDVPGGIAFAPMKCQEPVKVGDKFGEFVVLQIVETMFVPMVILGAK